MAKDFTYMTSFSFTRCLKPLIIFIIACCIFTISFAQPITQTVRGIVIDVDSKQILTGVNILVIDSDPLVGTTTDDEGNFRIENLSVGRHSFQFSHLGFESQILSNLNINSGKEIVLTIEMAESVVSIKSLTLSANGSKSAPLNKTASVSARSFNIEETGRFAAGINDPARIATAFAGVSASGDDNNSIIIRGNSPRGLLWKLEGVEIPNPNHFGMEGSTGGAVSMLNANVLTNSDFFTGAFPAEYGNALSGVFDIKMRNGNTEKREYAVQLGLLGLEAGLEGPFKKGKNASYLLNYRYSTFSILEKSGFNLVGDAVPNFQDLSYKFYLPTKKLGVFSIFGLAGNSTITNGGNDWNSEFETNMAVTGVNHFIRLRPNSYLKTTVSFSGTQTFANENWYDRSRMEFYKHYGQDFRKEWIRIASNYTKKINAKHTVKIGLVFTYNSFQGILEQHNDYKDSLERFEENGFTTYQQYYGNWKYRLSENLVINSGIHFMYYNLSNKYSLEPRIGLQWEFRPNHSLRAGFGIHSKFESLANHLMRIYSDSDQYEQANKNIEFTKARHFVVGYDHSFQKNWHILFEVYFQQLYDVPVEKDTPSYFSTLNQEDGFVYFALSNQGLGTNYGIEATLERFFSKGWYSLLTVSLFDSKYEGSNSVLKNTKFNVGHIANLLAGKEFNIHKKNILGLNLKTTWSGGKRYIPIDLDASRQAGYAIYNYDLSYDNALNDYFRIDAQISYKINRKNTSHEIKLDAQNITNRLNEKTVYYDRESYNIDYSYQLGLVPVISYKILF